MEMASGGAGGGSGGGGGGSVGGGCGGGDEHRQLHGLKFGKKIYFEDATTAAGGGGGTGSGRGSASVAPSASSSKAAAGGGAGRGGGGKNKGKGVAAPPPPPPPPRCQVEGCGADLSGIKNYYCRHKVCFMHSKAPRVVVAGLEQRFCQQCSRFHLLPEFDQGKRSCRRRLAGHNERRRRPQTPLASRYGRLAASVGEEHRRFRSFTLDFSYPRVPSSVRNAWPAIQQGDRISAGIQWHGNLAPHAHTSAVAGYGAHAYSGQGSSSSGPPVFPDPNLPPGGCLAGVGAATDSSCALSLLSTQPWDTTTHSATASHNQATAVSATTSFDDNPVAPSTMAGSYMAPSPWTGSRGHEGGGRSVTHQLPHEVSLDEVHPGPNHHAHFSGELELALQGNGPTSAPRINPGSNSTFDQSSNTMDWSL